MVLVKTGFCTHSVLILLKNTFKTEEQYQKNQMKNKWKQDLKIKYYDSRIERFLGKWLISLYCTRFIYKKLLSRKEKPFVSK